MKDYSIKNYVSVLKDVVRDVSKSGKLPKGYSKLKNYKEKVNLLESVVLKSLNRKLYYKIYLDNEK